MANKKHISIIPLGCPKNDVDSELIAGAFKKEGYDIEWDKIGGETVVINTCGFIRDAIEESLDTIMQSIKAKKDGAVKRVVVTGCLAQRFGEKLSSQLKEVDLFVGVNGFENIPYLLKHPPKHSPIAKTPLTSYPERLERVAYRNTYSAYIKISDGCSNRCSYCVIPFIKGNMRSRQKEDIVDEAKALADKGAVELNLIAQDTMNFGMDRGQRELISLLKALEKIDRIKWIRLNYLYPSHITEDFISFITDSEKILKYFDMPIQHASDRILRLMNRKTDSNDIKRTIDLIKHRIDVPFLRTTVIVGFPGESDKDFNELLKFFEINPFHRIGVFPYSDEEPAPASRLRNKIPQKTIIERFNIMNEFARKQMRYLSSDSIDKTYEALIEGTDPAEPSVTLARPWFLAPEIDGYIMIYDSDSHAKGKFRNVRITDLIGADFTGEFVQ